MSWLTPLALSASQMLSTTSLKLSNAAASVAMSYVGVLWSILADLVLFRDPPSALSLAGAAVICCSSYLVVRSEQQRSGSGIGSSREGQHGSGKGGNKRHASDSREGGNDEETVELIAAGRKEWCMNIAGEGGHGTPSQESDSGGGGGKLQDETKKGEAGLANVESGREEELHLVHAPAKAGSVPPLS